MATWASDITTALEQLGGVAPLNEIYDRVRRIRPEPHPADLTASVRGCIEGHSSDSTVFKGKKGEIGKDLFFSVDGIGGGVWGLRSYEKQTPTASDIDVTTSDNEVPPRQRQEVYRILRDTSLARRIKLLHKHRCQLCGESIALPNGGQYSEAHHIQPLGRPHTGRDIAENIIVLCPNHHAMLDYGAIPLVLSEITIHPKHSLGTRFIQYHNEVIMGKQV